MRKIIALSGFIMLLFSLWLFSFTAIFDGFNGLLYSFIFCIAGIITMIVAVVIPPKEMKEPFKSMIEKFEEMNKPLLIASILIFFSSLWLFSYGFGGTTCYNVSETITLFHSGGNATTNESILQNMSESLFIHLNNNLLILSYLEMIAGSIYIASGVNILQRKNISFIISSIIFGISISIFFAHYCFGILTYNWGAESLGVSAASSVYARIMQCLVLPIIISITALFLVIWQYKKFMHEKEKL